MLKKQTVWLLTMLSLMIVLSVYYMTSPSQDQVALLYDQEEQKEGEGTQEEKATSEEDVVETQGEQTEEMTSSMSSDEYFVAMRMQIDDNRSKQLEELEQIVSSGDVSASEVNEAVAQKRQLEERSMKEDVVEQTIQAKAEYPDVLVRSKEDKVFVTVKANELSREDSVQIMEMVYDEFGTDNVSNVEVEFQPYEQ
ncbi:stage III sporulation protein AH [Pontibacillus litoralis JSM 072002]|uniref:Stage III sporulation protein AH n=2 Tax=Pontibacillus TaxID=289201 RepID=A0A0A5HZ06_9BACI|nr:stage III sporulation protein AH [Pontibacillus litoralis JSM 072002]